MSLIQDVYRTVVSALITVRSNVFDSFSLSSDKCFGIQMNIVLIRFDEGSALVVVRWPGFSMGCSCSGLVRDVTLQRSLVVLRWWISHLGDFLVWMFIDSSRSVLHDLDDDYITLLSSVYSLIHPLVRSWCSFNNYLIRWLLSHPYRVSGFFSQ